MDHLQAGRGAQFEPKLVDILVSQITEFTALRASFLD